MKNGSITVMKALHRLAILLALGATALVAWGQTQPPAQSAGNRIESITVASQQSGSIIVKITLKQPLVSPPGTDEIAKAVADHLE